jgi:hypothetical protein
VNKRTAYTIQNASVKVKQKMKISSINEQTQDEFPPHPYLEQVALNCSEAQTTYIRLWRIRDPRNIIILRRKDAQTFFLRQVVCFENDLMKLCAQGLLSYTYDKKKKTFEIELTGWSDETEY